MIPSNLKNYLYEPSSPWHLSQELSARLEPKHPNFKAAELKPSDPEYQLILSYFMADKPPGTCITKITCIYNRFLQQEFISHLNNIEDEAKKFHPSWKVEHLFLERKKVIKNWQTLISPYSPLKLTIEEKEQTLNHAKVLPLWHGTSLQKSQSICETGFTYFGKHACFSGKPSKEGTDVDFLVMASTSQRVLRMLPCIVKVICFYPGSR